MLIFHYTKCKQVIKNTLIILTDENTNYFLAFLNHKLLAWRNYGLEVKLYYNL